MFELDDVGPNRAGPGHVVDVLTAPYADLVPTTVAADATAQSGELITVTWAVENRGIGVTNTVEWTDRVFVTADPTGVTGRRQIGSSAHLGALPVGAAYTRTARFALPADLATGRYYVAVEAGGPLEFVFTDNNRGVSGPVDVLFVAPPQGDLEVLAVVAPSAVNEGQGATVTWTVRNNGPDAVSGTWSDRVLLAPNGDLAQAVTLRTFATTLTLAAGHTYTRSELLTLPREQGVFRFFVRTDVANEQAEANEGNNVLGADGAVTLSINPPPHPPATPAPPPPPSPSRSPPRPPSRSPRPPPPRP